MIDFTDDSFLAAAVAFALCLGSYVLVGLRHPQFQGYRESRLNLVNTAVCAAGSVGAFNLLMFVFTEKSNEILSTITHVCWIIGVLLAIVNSQFSTAVRATSSAILVGYPVAVAFHPADATSFLEVVDKFFQVEAAPGDTDGIGLRASHALLTIHYFISFFFIANYYGGILRIRNVQMTKLGEANALTAEAVNNTIALASAVLSVLTSLLFVGVDIKMLGILTALVTAGAAAIFKELLTNIAAGILLIIHGDINERDVLEIDDLGVGVVKKITLRHTVVADRNEISVLVPNVWMLKNKIRHFTYNGKQTRLTADIGVSYDADVDKAIAIMQSVCFHVDRVLASPEPKVQIRSTNDYDITLRLCFWVDTPDVGIGNVKSEVLHYLIREFAQNDIIIPYPVIELRNVESLKKSTQQVSAAS